jgi:Na+-transporting methylmalonyl-CoA/oxaloacetate decarboxylase gamma subunit
MEQFWTGVQITALGIGVVFTALVLISLVLSVFGPLERLIVRLMRPRTQPRVAQPIAAPAEDLGLTPELVAVIAAAATAALRRPVRVHRIRYDADPSGAAWVQQGRLTIMASRRTKS